MLRGDKNASTIHENTPVPVFLAFALISAATVAIAACIVSYRHVMNMAVMTSEQIVEKTANEIDNLFLSPSRKKRQ